MTPPTVTRSIEIAAEPSAVYALVTDLGVLAELAEETRAMQWRDGAPATVRPGLEFDGANCNGIRRWSTRCTVTDAEADSSFAFEVRSPFPPVPIARWQYDIESADGGCRVTESTWDRRPAWFRRPAAVVTGVADRDVASARHIEATLARLKQRAESG